MAVLIGVLSQTLPAKAADDLRIAVARTPWSLPVYVAEAEGYFAAEGVTLRLVDCAFGKICLGKMLTGEVEFATVADTPLMFAALEGAKFYILATMVTSASNAKLIVRAGAGIARPKDLAGKKIGVFERTSAHYFLDSYLLFYDIDPTQVSISPVKPDEVVQALQSGKFDALAIFEPYSYEVVEKVPRATAMSSIRIVTGTFNLVATPAALAGREKELEGIMRALQRANKLIRIDPDRAKMILMSRLQLSRNYVEATWRENQFQLSMDQSLLATLESGARWATRGGYVRNPQKPNFLDYLYPGPVRKVAPEFVTLFR